MPSTRSSSKRKNNPLSRFFLWYFIVVFVLVGLGLLADQDWVFSRFGIAAVFLVGGLAGLAWTFFSLQMGRITLVSSSTGGTYVYERRESPFWYFSIATMYIVFCLVCTALGVFVLFA